MREVKVGLVGFGFSGATFHAPVIEAVEGLTISTVVSSNADKVHRSLPEVKVVSSVEELLTDQEIELVIITTPNEFHFPMAKQALEAGKHVVLEKPFTVSVEEGERLIAVAEESHRLLSVYHNRRYDSDFLTIQQLVKEEKLGSVITYEAHYDRYRAEVRDRWREQDKKGSGILFDLGSHLIDQALTLFGKPDSVYADIMAQRVKGKTDDYFHLILHYGKKRVILHGGSLVKKHGPRYQIHGIKGSFLKWGIDPQEEALIAGRVPGDAGWGEEAPEQFGVLTNEEGNHVVKSLPGSYQTYYAEVYQALIEDSAPTVTAEEALNVMKVIELAFKSSEEKKVMHWV
ncbi:oxidoreductase [Pseudalkalibacillus hwajinpoensis]|uniref:oxidoreductase n=1 Tax=Guptibacillus hwajinpoensis TaxID=208199 RepID=UPI001CD52F2E|nr:oxidoreductase [Pseudalkalibacillus hwajinpoensis]MCA0991174.1 oxidoreductase [Pseudalkalibacillus hwajinpoensis]